MSGITLSIPPEATTETSNENDKTLLVSRNLVINGHRTSARLEPEMWVALFDIVRREGRSVHEVCSLIAQSKPEGCSLTAAVRVFIVAYFRAAATEEGHARAHHGYGDVSIPHPSPFPAASHSRTAPMVCRGDKAA